MTQYKNTLRKEVDMKQNQFKPLHSWRDAIGEIPVYATTFFFNNILGLLY